MFLASGLTVDSDLKCSQINEMLNLSKKLLPELCYTLNVADPNTKYIIASKAKQCIMCAMMKFNICPIISATCIKFKAWRRS